jgi:predicted acetyltransferase
MNHRSATPADAPLLATLNRELIKDEGHRNRMTVPELEERMRGWLAGEYTAILFEDQGTVVAYALFRELVDQIYLRQLYVVRTHRRLGLGREAMTRLRTEIWPRTKRLTVEVLIGNAAALAFWRAVGYRDYSLTLEIPLSE